MKLNILLITFLLLTSILNAQMSFDSLLIDYTKGKLHDYEKLRELASQLKDKDYKLAKRIADKLINDLPEDSLYVKRNLHFMYDFTKNSSDRGFTIFMNHADKVEELTPIITEKAHCLPLVKFIIYNEEIKQHLKSLNNEPDWLKIRTNLKKYGKLGTELLEYYRYPIVYNFAVKPYLQSLNGQPNWYLIKRNLKPYGKKGEEYFHVSQIFFFGSKRRWAELAKISKVFFLKFPTGSALRQAMDYNNLAWSMFNNCDDTSELKAALGFAKLATIQDEKEVAFRDTYANILYKLGNVKEAIENQELALRLNEVDDIRVNYEKMRVGAKTWKKDE